MSKDSMLIHLVWINNIMVSLIQMEDMEYKIEKWISYFSVNPNLQGRGITKKALGILLTNIDVSEHNSGPLITNVSDRNLPSINILSQNGFVPDLSRKIYPARIVMGGNNMPMIRNVRH